MRICWAKSPLENQSQNLQPYLGLPKEVWVTIFNPKVVDLYKGDTQPEIHDEGSPTGESFI